MTKQLGVVIPAYKEEQNIAALIQEICCLVPSVKIMVVDDSPDEATVRAVRALNLLNVEIIHRQVKGGRGSAVLDGIRVLLTKDCTAVLEMDADFSHPPAQIPELVSYAQSQNLDLLIASRYLPKSEIHHWPLSRRVFSKSANLLARALLQVPIKDYTNGYRLYSRRAAEEIIKTCGKLGAGFIALSEILVNLYYRGYRIGEVSTVFVNRARGESSLSRREISNALTGLLKIHQLKRRLRGTRAA